MHDHHRGIEVLNGDARQGTIEAERFAAAANADRLGQARGDDVSTLVRPESPTIAADARQSEFPATSKGHGVAIAVEQPDARPLQDVAHGFAPHAPAVVVAQDRDDRHLDGGEQLAGDFDFGDFATLGDIPRDDQQVGGSINGLQVGGELIGNVGSQVQVANGGNAMPCGAFGNGMINEEIPSANGRVRRRGGSPIAVEFTAPGGGDRATADQRAGFYTCHGHLTHASHHHAGHLHRMTISLPSAPRVLFAVLATICLLAGGWVAPVAALEPPDLTAASVYAYDLETGIVLYEKNADDRRQVGSTVKVATALTVMKYGNPEDEVVIEQGDTVDITLYSNMQLTAGDTLTVGTLLYGLLLPSGNDGAMALSRHVGYELCSCDDANEARSAFMAAMNEIVAELGLTNTHFENPDGIDHDSAYSSAHDMAILFGELMKNNVWPRSWPNRPTPSGRWARHHAITPGRRPTSCWVPMG